MTGRLSALALALPALVLAEKEREKPPAPAPPKNLELPAQKKLALSNGLAVTLVPYGAIPKATISVAVQAGAVDESTNETWLAKLTADLLTEGTRSRGATQIAEAAARMGGSIEAAAGADLTNVGIEVLAESAADAVRLVADVVRNPVFADADFARRKNDLARQLSIARSQPHSLAEEKFMAALYAGHPYGRLFPSPEQLQALTGANVRGFHAAHYGAARAHLYVVGVFDEGTVRSAIEGAFGDWKRGSHVTPHPPRPHAARALHLVDRPGAVQSTLYLGMPVIDPSQPDYVKLQVTNALLGGSFMSRITSNIREQKGYTYSPRSTVSTRRRDAYWAEIADVTTKDTGASLKEIFAEIARLKAEPPSAVELKGIQRYLAGTFVLRNSSRDGIVEQLRFVDLNGLPDDFLSRYVERVLAVTPGEVQEMTAKHIAPDRAAIVVVGDLEKVRDQLAPYGRN